MAKYGELSIGQKNDLRYKLTSRDIQDIKFSQEKTSVLAKKYGVHRLTIDYHRNAEVNAKMREKNRHASHKWTARDNDLKQRRRNLVREKVREYTRNQMREFRKNKSK